MFGGHTVVVGGLDVLKVLDPREDRVRHAQFFTLVDIGGSAQEMKNRRKRSRTVIPVLFIAETTDRARLIVVAQVEAVPSPLGEAFLPARERVREVSCLQRAAAEFSFGQAQADVLELEDHVDFVARGIRVERRIFEEYSGGFPNGEDRAAALENLTVHFLEEFMQARSLHVEGASVGKILTGLAGAIGKAGDLGDQVDDIHSEAIDPAV